MRRDDCPRWHLPALGYSTDARFACFVLAIRRILFFQFWSAYVPCGAAQLNAVQLSLEQIDVIRRLAEMNAQHLTLVTSVKGEYGTDPHDSVTWKDNVTLRTRASYLGVVNIGPFFPVFPHSRYQRIPSRFHSAFARTRSESFNNAVYEMSIRGRPLALFQSFANEKILASALRRVTSLNVVRQSDRYENDHLSRKFRIRTIREDCY